ncbi:transmembrane protein 51b [Synchiropus splendidus]|uniref:transmembrane protein 51b n=1 Tax=Synchiropus splendidus TaxID=270530 RepID=UPI00237D9F07|nr:transmembrane protein 51b [Synchiropus splendidus]
MCSSRGLCNSGDRANRPSGSGGSSSGAHYALCALGVGLIALGIIMIVWTVIPTDGETAKPPAAPGNATADGHDNEDGDAEDHKSSSSVAMVLVGVGAAMLLLSLCLGVRSKRRARSRRNQPVATTGTEAAFLDHVPGEQRQPAVDPTSYNVPSYEEVVGSSDYPVRQSNLRSSISQLPSYEDILAAVEAEGADPASNPTEATPLNEAASIPEDTPTPDPPTDSPSLNSQNSLPSRSSSGSRASRFLRPLRVRRIKSDKLHLKDFRIQIRNPTQNPVTIEPITPPPQYDNKMPELV